MRPSIKPLNCLVTALLCIVLGAATTPATATVFGSETKLRPPTVPASMPANVNLSDLTVAGSMPHATAQRTATAPDLVDFGLALVRVDRATIRELAPFSSLVDIAWDHPELAELVRYAQSYDMKALISVHGLFFDHDEAGNGFLRAEVEQRWQTFVEGYREILGYGNVWAFYLVDEPFWNQIPLPDLVLANSIVKDTFPLIPTMVSMNRHDLDAAPADLPPGLFDIAGYHAYAVTQDPNTDPEYQHYLHLLREKFSGRDFVIVADAWWGSHPHGTAGFEPEQLLERAAQYRRVAEDIGAIALGAFVWQGLPGSVGLRELPEEIQREYMRIGSEISSRCGVPPSSTPLAGSTALFLQDCRFYVTAHWQNPDTGQEGEAIGVRLTRDTGVFWFFEPSNIELTVKLLDGTEHNDHWWVFWSHMTSLDVWLEVTDTVTATSVRYLQPGADTNAFPATASQQQQP